MYGIAAPPQTRIAVAPGNGDVGAGSGSTRTERRRTVLRSDPRREPPAPRLAAGAARRRNRRRRDPARAEADCLAARRPARARSARCRGAGRTTSVARHAVPARSGTGGAESCACGTASAKTSEKRASTAANVARVPYYLLRALVRLRATGHAARGAGPRAPGRRRSPAARSSAPARRPPRRSGGSTASSRARPCCAQRDQVGALVGRIGRALELAASVEPPQRVGQRRQRHAHLGREGGRRDRLDRRDQAEERELLTADPGLLQVPGDHPLRHVRCRPEPQEDGRAGRASRRTRP